MVALLKHGRAMAAPWALAIEPNATHGDSEDVMMDTEKQLIHPARFGRFPRYTRQGWLVC